MKRIERVYLQCNDKFTRIVLMNMVLVKVAFFHHCLESESEMIMRLK